MQFQLAIVLIFLVQAYLPMCACFTTTTTRIGRTSRILKFHQSNLSLYARSRRAKIAALKKPPATMPKQTTAQPSEPTTTNTIASSPPSSAVVASQPTKIRIPSDDEPEPVIDESEMLFVTKKRSDASTPEGEQQLKRQLLGMGMQQDFEDFQKRQQQNRPEGSAASMRTMSFADEITQAGVVGGANGGESKQSLIETAKNVISTILIVDFFVVIVFLVWFLVAAVLQSSYPVVLERFQDIFQPVVVPSLTVLMAGSIASGLLGDKEKN